MKKYFSILLLLAILCTSLSSFFACSEAEPTKPQTAMPPLTAWPPATTTKAPSVTTEPTTATTTETTTITTTEPPPPQYAEKVSFSQEDLYLVANGPSKTLYLSVIPAVIIDYSATVYAANSDIVSVSYNESDQSITFSGLKKGATTVVALFAGGQHAVINVVVQNLVTSIAFKKEIIYLGIGEKEAPTHTITPSHSQVEDSSYKYSFSNPRVADVVAEPDNHLIVGISPGTTTLTVTYAGGAQASIEVVVLDVACPQLFGAKLFSWDVISPEEMIVETYSYFTFSSYYKDRYYTGKMSIHDGKGTTFYEDKKFSLSVAAKKTGCSKNYRLRFPTTVTELYYDFDYSLYNIWY